MAKYKAKMNTKAVDTGKKNKKSATNKKQKAIKNKKMLSDEQVEVRRFIIILVVTIAIIVGLYFLSNSVVNKRKNADSDTETKEVEIAYDKASVGTILNRPYEEYYVMVYDSNDTKAQYYSSLITNYQNQDALKIYFVDLANPRNASFVAKNGTSNPNVTTDVTEFAFGPLTLVYVYNGTVYGYYEDLEEIKYELNI